MTLWRYRGVTDFTIFARFLRGEDIQPSLDFANAIGANTIRFFGQLDPDRGWPGWEDYRRPFDRPDFDALFHAFLDQVESAGLRVEATVCTYPDDASTHRAYVQRIIDALAARAVGHLCELANEPAAQGIDAVAINQGLNRRTVLCAAGYYDLVPTADPQVLDLPLVLDYLTTHTDRGPEWPRKAKDALDLRVGWDARGDTSKPPEARTFWRGENRPIVLDEPMGIDEVDQPGHRAGGELAITDRAAYAGVSALYGAGDNYFCQSLGINGIVPAEGSIQYRAAMAVRDVWQTVPLEAMTGGYVHDGVGDLALTWIVDADGLRCYGSIYGGTQIDVPVRPRVGWTPQAINGYRIVAQHAASVECQR